MKRRVTLSAAAAGLGCMLTWTGGLAVAGLNGERYQMAGDVKAQSNGVKINESVSGKLAFARSDPDNKLEVSGKLRGTDYVFVSDLDAQRKGKGKHRLSDELIVKSRKGVSPALSEDYEDPRGTFKTNKNRKGVVTAKLKLRENLNAPPDEKLDMRLRGRRVG